MFKVRFDAQNTDDKHGAMGAFVVETAEEVDELIAEVEGFQVYEVDERLEPRGSPVARNQQEWDEWKVAG